MIEFPLSAIEMKNFPVALEERIKHVFNWILNTELYFRINHFVVLVSRSVTEEEPGFAQSWTFWRTTAVTFTFLI